MSTLYPTDNQSIVQFGVTLRLHPENALIAHYDKERGHWVCDPDLAVPLAYQLVVKAALSNHDIKWSRPEDLKLYYAVSREAVKSKIECLKQAEIMELFLEGIGL